MAHKYKILAVDDNSISLATIEQILRDKYEVIPLNSGGRALQYLKKNQPDLILFGWHQRMGLRRCVKSVKWKMVRIYL